jgi:hypothetical protein
MTDTELDWGSLRKRADDSTKPPEPGWYVLECMKAERRNAQTSGNPMVYAQFRIVEGAAAGKTGIFNNFNLTVDNDFAMSIFFRNMAAFGLDDQYFASNPTLDQVAAALVGRRANVELGIETYQGIPRPRFKNVRAADGQLPVSGAASLPGMTSGPAGLPGTSTPAGLPGSSGTPTGLPGATPSVAPSTAPPALPY